MALVQMFWISLNLKAFVWPLVRWLQNFYMRFDFYQFIVFENKFACSFSYLTLEFAFLFRLPLRRIKSDIGHI